MTGRQAASFWPLLEISPSAIEMFKMLGHNQGIADELSSVGT